MKAKPDTSTAVDAPSAQPAPRRRRWKRRLLAHLFTFLLGMGAGLGASYYIYMEMERQDLAEERAYQALENSNDSADFQRFLDHYPRSGYADDVKSRMTLLRQAEEDWRRIAGSRNAEDFQRFRTAHSHPYYERLCLAKIDSLDWLAALADSSKAAIDHYMAVHPDGQFYAEATFAARQAEKRELSAAEVEMVCSTLDGFMSLLGRGDIATLQGYLPDVMDRFLEKKMATRGDVSLAVEKMFANGTRECIFSREGDAEIKKRIMAGSPAYSVRAVYAGSISSSDASSARHKRYVVRADVGEGHLVRAITMEAAGE